MRNLAQTTRHFSGPLRIIALITVLVALAYAVDLTPWLRGGFGWRWEYLPAPLMRIGVLAVALMVYVGVGWWLLRRSSRAWSVLLWAFVGTVMLSLGAAYVREGDILYMLFSRTISIPASSEWWIGANIDWQSGQWQDWLSVMNHLGERTSNAATSPPGMPMIYGLTTGLLERWPDASDSLYRILLPTQCANFDLLRYSPAQWASAWVGILTPVAAAFGVFPLYSITRSIRPAADTRLPSLWWPLVPGLLGFLTSSSTLYPVLALIIFHLLMRGIQRQHGLLLLSAGVIYGVGLFFNFVFLPLTALYGFYTLIYYAFRGRSGAGWWWWTPLLVGLVFGLGAALPWLAFYLLTGQTFFAILSQALSTHLDLERPYLYWVWMHVWDWGLWTGLALALVWLWGLGRWLRGWLRARQGDAPLIALTLLLTVLAFTLSGTTRGESGRIWLVLSPFALIAAVEVAKPSRDHASGYGWITAAQAVCTLVLTVVIAAHNAPDITPTPQAPAPLSVQRPSDAVFSGSSSVLYRLTGWDAQSDADSIQLTLNWQALHRPDQPQWFSAILVSPEGEAYPPFEWQPGGLGDVPRYPTTCWTPSNIIGDQVEIPLPAGASPGGWYISLAAFGDDTLPEGRLQVISADGTADLQVGLGPVSVGQ